MIQLSDLLAKISAFVAYQDYLPLWIAVGIILAVLIFIIFRRPARVIRYRKWLMLLVVLMILGAIIFWAPKIKFYYDTRIDLPSYLSEQEKQQYLDRWREAMNTTERGKNNSGIYNDIGILRSSFKDYNGAVRAFKLAISKNPEDPRFYRNLGITYTYLDKYPEAEAAFRESFKLAPTQPEYWIELGELYSFKIKDPQKTRLFYLEALGKSNDNLQVVQAFALYLENVEKDYSEAIKYWQILADKVTEDKPAFLAHIAELQLRVDAK